MFNHDSEDNNHFIACPIHNADNPVVSFYVLRGESHDLTSYIVGRIETGLNELHATYKGEELEGGTYVGSYDTLLKSMRTITRLSWLE